MVGPLLGALSGPWQFHVSSYEVKELVSLLPGLKERSVKDSKFHCVKLNIVVFWDMTPCSLVGAYQLFRVHFNYPEDGGSISPETFETIYQCTCCHNHSVQEY